MIFFGGGGFQPPLRDLLRLDWLDNDLIDNRLATYADGNSSSRDRIFCLRSVYNRRFISYPSSKGVRVERKFCLSRNLLCGVFFEGVVLSGLIFDGLMVAMIDGCDDY